MVKIYTSNVKIWLVLIDISVLLVNIKKKEKTLVNNKKGMRLHL